MLLISSSVVVVVIDRILSGVGRWGGIEGGDLAED